MSKLDQGGAAFPCYNPKLGQVVPGMTLHQWFAGQALQGILAAVGNRTDPMPENVSEMAMEYADGMIAGYQEREEST